MEEVNGVLIGWEGITPEELAEQRALALLPAVRVYKNREGQQHERLTYVRPVGRVSYPSGSKRTQWLLQCACGRLCVMLDSTIRFDTKSCGCVNNERRSAFMQTYNRNNKDQASERLKAQLADPAFLNKRNEGLVKWRLSEEGKKVQRCNMLRVLRKQRIRAGLSPDSLLTTHHQILRWALGPLQKEIIKNQGCCAVCGTVAAKLRVHHIHMLQRDSDLKYFADPRYLVAVCDTPCHKLVIHRNNFRAEPDPSWTPHLLSYAHARESEVPCNPQVVMKVEQEIQRILTRV